MSEKVGSSKPGCLRWRRSFSQACQPIPPTCERARSGSALRSPHEPCCARSRECSPYVCPVCLSACMHACTHACAAMQVVVVVVVAASLGRLAYDLRQRRCVLFPSLWLVWLHCVHWPAWLADLFIYRGADILPSSELLVLRTVLFDHSKSRVVLLPFPFAGLPVPASAPTPTPAALPPDIPKQALSTRRTPLLNASHTEYCTCKLACHCMSDSPSAIKRFTVNCCGLLAGLGLERLTVP
jgi:hypothetical protein